MQTPDFVAPRARLLTQIVALVGEGEIPRFEEALTHTSFANEVQAIDNQRLEFLGDAVLGLCVSELLASAHPTADEGMLTRMRSALVNAEALARWARGADLGASLALGKGARAGSEREQTNVLSDAVEALVAAVYEAHGIEGARALVREVVREPMLQAEQLGGARSQEHASRAPAGGGTARSVLPRRVDLGAAPRARVRGRGGGGRRGRRLRRGPLQAPRRARRGARRAPRGCASYRGVSYFGGALPGVGASGVT